MKYGTVLVVCGMDPVLREQLTGISDQVVVLDDPHTAFDADVKRMIKSAQIFSAETKRSPPYGPQPRTKYPRRS